MTIDDEEALRRMLLQALEHAGYEVVDAKDGREAPQQSYTVAVDLVISDILIAV